MRQGSQAWNSYGNRTNLFLLENYGFCFKDNLYDSYEFNVRMDVETEEAITAASIIAPEEQEDSIQQIRMKLHHLNFVLIAYLRMIHRTTYKPAPSKGKAASLPLLTAVTDLDYELKMMLIYIDIVNNLILRIEVGENRTTLEEDQKLLQEGGDSMSMAMHMSITYRSEQKRILRSHLEMSEFMITIIKAAKNMQEGYHEVNATRNYQQEYKNLYMSPRPSEVANITQTEDNQINSTSSDPAGET